MYAYIYTCCVCLCALKVLQIFEEVQKRHSQGQVNPAFEDDLPQTDIQGHISSEIDDTAESGRGSGNSTPSLVSPEQSPVLRNES